MRSTFALLLLLGLGLVGAARAADEPADSFSGKVVLVRLDEKGPAYPLTDAKIQDLGGKAYIVGVGADCRPEGHWITGTKLRIAIDRISMMAEFTPAQWEKYRDAANAYWGRQAAP